MRYRLMATYRGVPYEAGVGPSGSDVVLFAACPPPEELGFEPATGHWRKRVIRAEVDALWESRPVGNFRNEPCMVLDDLGYRLHIAYRGENAALATSLGYWQVDRGVFELLTPRDEVTGLIEERVEKPLLWGPPGGTAGPSAASGCPPGTSSASLRTWRPSRGRRTHWKWRRTARCAWCQRRTGTRFSWPWTARGTKPGRSPMRKRPISTCSACWPPRRSATAGCCPRLPPRAPSTTSASPCSRSPQRLTSVVDELGARARPVRLSCNCRRG